MSKRRRASTEGNKQTAEIPSSFSSIPFFEVNTEANTEVNTAPAESAIIAEVASEAIETIVVTPIETFSEDAPSIQVEVRNGEAEIVFDDISEVAPEEAVDVPADLISEVATETVEETEVPKLGEIAVPVLAPIDPESSIPSLPTTRASTVWSTEGAVWTEGPTSSQIRTDDSDLSFLLEENAQLMSDVQRLREQNNSLRWQLEQAKGDTEREARHLNLEISRLSLEIASQNNEYDSRVAELLSAHSENCMALRAECDQRVARVIEELSRLSLWQIDQGSKRSIVVGSDAQDAIRRLVASGTTDIKKQPITAVRVFNEKFIV